MAKNIDTQDILSTRKPLSEICTVPERIISVYALEQHVWAKLNSSDARRSREPELQTIEEFQIDPVRSFLTDILRNMAAPYKRDRRENPIGQGYWIQAEFGSGKSHLLCCLSALALGNEQAWSIVRTKETAAQRGKRDSLFRFWEEGLEEKSKGANKGIFVIVKTLVGQGSGTVGLADKGRKLTEYILDAAKEQLKVELGKNVSLYPAELLADRFLKEDLDLLRNKLRKFLRDPKYFEEDEYEDVDDFIRAIQVETAPEYKKSCGKKLWTFYEDYLGLRPQLAAEPEDILKHLVETILEEGYSGVLLVLDEVSLFMKDRHEDLRTDDEKTLVVLSNRLAKVHNLPIWTVCSAQQQIESKMGVKNIIADDRLKLVELLKEDKDYYTIVLNRVRDIVNPGAISNYYVHYKRGFSWPNNIGPDEFASFFPFHKPALEVLRAITHELTTARSAIHFMHHTLKHQIDHKGQELIRLWELFDEAVKYEEDPSGVHAPLVAIKTKREAEYRAFEAGKRQIDSLTKGPLKVHRDKAVKIMQTLFLYHIARTRQTGVSPEELANAVLIEKDSHANVDENIQHYEQMSEYLRKELSQIVVSFDEDNQGKYRFEPIFTGIDPRNEFQKARDEAESNEALRRESWDYLLSLSEWTIRLRQSTIELTNDIHSPFKSIAGADQIVEVDWQGRQISGKVGMRDFAKMVSNGIALPAIDSDQTDNDFAIYIGTSHVNAGVLSKLLAARNDRRIIVWAPAPLTTEEEELLIDFAAYRKLISDWQGKESDDAVAVINWTAEALQIDLGKIKRIIDNSYARGRIDSINNTQMEFHFVGELSAIISPLVDRVLSATYESRDIRFEPQFVFRKDEGIKVINGIVKNGSIPKGAKPNKDSSAAQNFGFGLQIISKNAERQLDTSKNRFVTALWQFIDSNLSDENQTISVDTLYKNFMGIGCGGSTDFGLTRRMVQIYLLCLVQQAKLRILTNTKSGLANPVIDYSNVSSIDFTGKIVDSFSDVQKLATPEDWDIIRPYAEKLLGKSIAAVQDDAAISAYRVELREVFSKKRQESGRLLARCRALFELLKIKNPYEAELEQTVKLFQTDFEADNDIQRILYALQQCYGYHAFDSKSANPAEVDDLANRLKNYHDLEVFVQYEPDLRSVHAYSLQDFSHSVDLQKAHMQQQELMSRVRNIKDYIDSEVKLRTEIIGKIPAEPGEFGTLGSLIAEYKTIYTALHDSVIDESDNAKRVIEDLIHSDEIEMLKALEKAKALQPCVAPQLASSLREFLDDLFLCEKASRQSLEEQLNTSPTHDCGLSFDNYKQMMSTLTANRKEAEQLVEQTVIRKLSVLLNDSLKERLAQGISEPFLAGLNGCSSVDELRSYLVRAISEEPKFAELIDRYAKRVSVKAVKLTDFKPSISTIQKEQIDKLVQEFKAYLEEEFRSISDNDEDSLPMLQVE